MIKLKEILTERAIMKKNYTGGNYGEIIFSDLELKILKSVFNPKYVEVRKDVVVYEWETSEYDDEGAGVRITKEPYDKDMNFTIYVSHAWEYGAMGSGRNKEKSAASQKFEGEAPKLLKQFLKELELGDW